MKMIHSSILLAEYEVQILTAETDEMVVLEKVESLEKIRIIPITFKC